MSLFFFLRTSRLLPAPIKRGEPFLAWAAFSAETFAERYRGTTFMDAILLVGLDQPEIVELRGRLDRPVLAFETLPRVRVDRGVLLVEHPHAINHFVPVERVAFHAIFEDDFDFLTALTLWGGPCLPGARGMMDLRLRLPDSCEPWPSPDSGAFQEATPTVAADASTVVKWGNWHCGEDKALFDDAWTAEAPTLFERFVEGDAVRIILVGDRAWQVRMTGDGWLKSIHDKRAAFMPIDDALLDDARRLADHFGLRTVGVDYIAAPDGDRYLLEVNHVPNVTVFPEVREAYLELVVRWAGESRTD